MDIRHPLQHFDMMMLEWAYSRHLFVHILLTKADKLNRGPANKVLLEVKQQLKKMKLDFSIQLFFFIKQTRFRRASQCDGWTIALYA